MKRTTFVIAGATALLVSSPGVGQSDPIGAVATAAPGQGVPVAAALADEAAPVLRITANGGPEQAGDEIRRLDSSGWAPVNAVVVGSNGGRAVRAEGRFGTWGIRLPAFSAGMNPGRAVVRVVGTGPGDPLEPRLADFRFGAAWKLDATSDGSAADDGDNLLQRGLAGAEGQLKLQIDNLVPMCTVKGDQGAVVAKAEPVQPNVWYRTRCVRQGDTVSIRVSEMTGAGAGTATSATERGPIGSVQFTGATPLSVGGKLTTAGDLVTGSGDQFNGVVDNVVFDTDS